MSVGQVLDYIDTFVEMKNPDKKEKNVREATQEDFNMF